MSERCAPQGESLVTARCRTAAWQDALGFYNRRRDGAVPRSAVIAEELAMAIGSSLREPAGALAAIRDLRRAHPASAVIGGRLAVTLSHAVRLYADAGDTAKADALFQELRHLRASLPEMPDMDAAQQAHSSAAQGGRLRAITKS